MTERAEVWGVIVFDAYGWKAWRIIEEGPAGVLVAIPDNALYDRGTVSPDCIIARHHTKEAAEAAVARAKAAELQIRPFWQETVALEAKYRVMMWEAQVSAAQPPEAFH
jgi:hypothetical protein